MAAAQVQHTTHRYLSAFIDELVRSGVRHTCVCPGSRSTPLAMLFAELAKISADIKLWMHLDERSAAFFALGLAKALRQPVVLLCTSGTAAANFLPAVVEAHYARVPLIVLTADRPAELRDVGAPQTIDQLHIYGAYTRWFAEVALPESTPEMLRYIRTIANRAVAESIAGPPGPVHLNFPFREPLVPVPADEHHLDGARSGHTPYTAVAPGLRRADESLIGRLAAELVSLERGLIICGPQADPAFPDAVARLSNALGYPILADPLSQVRCGQHDRRYAISAYDASLRAPAIVEWAAPQVVLRFGAVPTSKPLVQYLSKYADARQILIDGENIWRDPALIVSESINADARLFCEDLAHQVGGLAGRDGRSQTWLGNWLALEQGAHSAIEQQLASFDDLFEGCVFAELARLLPDGATLYVSSSMPVRDLDTFFAGNGRKLRFLANRGANGIDGVVSSALGAGAASENGDPLVLVIGDLAFYHDMNGLLAAKLHHLNATIVLINNDGGGIFSFLPQAAFPEHFERLFGTPHGLDFRQAAALYDATYTCVADWDSFRKAVAQGVNASGLHIVEVQTNRERNVQQHRAVWKAVSTALAGITDRTAYALPDHQ
jgi:2-succinyl-5-enolpyruvyl-6-hydroxy-3-cyclohexene-1-carboxylate synthase